MVKTIILSVGLAASSLTLDARAQDVRQYKIALLAGEEAISQSGIGSKGHFPGPLFLALPPLEIEWPYRMQRAEQAIPGGDAGYPDLMRVAREPQFAPIYETLKYGIIGEHLADYFGTEGSPISLTTACASGATAIQLGVEAIRRGECQAALALGADGSLTPESLVRFSLLSALSTQNDPPAQASKPFSKNRDGFVLVAERVVVRDDRGGRVTHHDIVVVLEVAPLLQELVLRVVVELRRGHVAGRARIEHRL